VALVMKLFIVDSRDGEVVSLKALPREIERHYPQETQRQDLRDVMTNHWCKQEMFAKSFVYCNTMVTFFPNLQYSKFKAYHIY
jgi:hypothetical protein